MYFSSLGAGQRVDFGNLTKSPGPAYVSHYIFTKYVFSLWCGKRFDFFVTVRTRSRHLSLNLSCCHGTSAEKRILQFLNHQKCLSCRSIHVLSQCFKVLEDEKRANGETESSNRVSQDSRQAPPRIPRSKNHVNYMRKSVHVQLTCPKRYYVFTRYNNKTIRKCYILIVNNTN